MSLSNGEFWNLMGGKVAIRNSSGGYPKVVFDWMKKYFNEKQIDDGTFSVLLVGEGLKSKEDFLSLYPNWKIDTNDKSLKFSLGEVDILGDIGEKGLLEEKKYNLVLCQSVLEHVFDPVACMKNMISSLKNGGLLYISTHPPHSPGFPYHGYKVGPEADHCPDNFRFFSDFFIDFEKKSMCKVKCVEMLEINSHILVCYQKQENGV